MKIRKILAILFLALGGALAGPPVVFLANVWLHDELQPLPVPAAGTNDASHLNDNKPSEVITIAPDPREAERQLVELVHRATREKLHVSISGAHHSMGGHTLYPGGIVLDMLPFNHMSLDESTSILTVGAGARWLDIIPYLDQRGRAVAIMQSNNDFSVGGSLSVNCHGWQNNSPPISSTVESFRVLLASGEIKTCSRTENRELFSLVLGGYGLFGVMLEAKLHVVANEYYIAEAHKILPADYDRVYHELTGPDSGVGMAYGRINVAPSAFMEKGLVTVLKRQPPGRPTAGTLTEQKPEFLKRLVFRGSAGSAYGKNLRWWLEEFMGETSGKLLSRNQIMNEPSDLYATRDGKSTDILHEYFIPAERLGEFVEKARPVFLKHRPDLMNITVRNVEPDKDTFLRYADTEVFGLVMLFQQGRDETSELAMQSLAQDLIDTALGCGGHYYLTYRPHATLAQFRQSYPQAESFFLLKRRYDPDSIFENKFFLKYGRPILDEWDARQASLIPPNRKNNPAGPSGKLN